MLIPDEYVHAQRLFGLAISFIRRRLDDYVDKHPEDGWERTSLGFRARMAAAQFCELTHRKFGSEGLYRAFKPYCDPIAIDELTFEHNPLSKLAPPRFFMDFERLGEGAGGGSRHIRRTWTETTESDFWVIAILDWKIPDGRPNQPVTLSSFARFTPVVDLESGTINLSNLRKSIKTAKAGAKFESARQKQEIPLPVSMAHFFEKADTLADGFQSKLRALEPFEPYPLVIRQEHFSKVLEGLQNAIDGPFDETEEMGNPVEQIREIAELDQSLTKKKIYQAMGGPNRFSWRRFQMYWAIAAKANPMLSKAGRKPQIQDG